MYSRRVYCQQFHSELTTPAHATYSYYMCPRFSPQSEVRRRARLYSATGPSESAGSLAPRRGGAHLY